jgi:[acyl-carrier-protein] S-malonyltransferase
MSKTALLFAGQGAQTVGMGKDLAEKFPAAKELFDRANKVLGYDLARLCFEGPEEELTKTENAQPGIFLVGWVAFHALKERLPTLSFHATAGLSLGEYTALAAAGVLSFEDALEVVHQRGRYMQEACESPLGSMAAIIGLDLEGVRQICSEEDVEIANLNCPGQIVISGMAEKVNAACEKAKGKGAKRCLLLPVAGAYHSRLMAPAKGKLESTLESIPFNAPVVPVISNVTAEPHGNPPEIQKLLVEQITSPVRWEDSMRHLLSEGFTRFIELGPGTALSGFLKRIDKDAQLLNVADMVSLKSTVQTLTT